jgi:glycolate oxidase FAD binding subunit
MTTLADNPTLTADSPDAVAAIVRDCLDKRLPLIDYGVAHLGLGHAPPDTHARLDQDGHVVEHYEQDMALRVAAGARFGAVQAALRQAGQFLPIDADSDMTIGEIITHHVWGPLRVGYGSVRDLLLGLSYVDGDGQLIHVGGRTVKNVAGLDVTRLMVNSLGELGVIVEATLRTYAIPAHVLAVDLHVDDPAHLDRIMTTWLACDAAPARLAIGIEGGEWVGRVAYFGRQTGCLSQLRALERLLDTTRGIHIAGAGSLTLPQYLMQREVHRSWRRQSLAMVRVIVPPADTGAVCSLIQEWASDNVSLGLGAVPSHGCIFAGAMLRPHLAESLDHTIHRIIEPLGGLRVWHNRPTGARIAPFAPIPPDMALLRRIKQAMDPHNLFNPGRLIRDSES